MSGFGAGAGLYRTEPRSIPGGRFRRNTSGTAAAPEPVHAAPRSLRAPFGDARLRSSESDSARVRGHPLPGDARHTIEFLVRNHLAMSQVAFRRDLDDPHVVAQFAHLVGTEELLKMLCLMTLVDVEAVSSTILTPWKEELLWRLYVETYNHLTLGYGDELVPQDPAGLALVIARRPRHISGQ